MFHTTFRRKYNFDFAKHPNHRHTRCKHDDNGERICSTRHIYREKCTEILAYHPGHSRSNRHTHRRGGHINHRRRVRGGMLNGEANGKVARLNCESGMLIQILDATYGRSCGVRTSNAKFNMRQKCNGHRSCIYRVSTSNLGDPAKGCRKDFTWSYKCQEMMQDSRSGYLNYHEVDGVGGHLVESRWDNTYCHRRRVPICQKPRGEVFAGYIGVRAARTYHQASQWCQTWYGTQLATIRSDEDNRNAQEACQRLDIMKRKHCWIGLQRPFKKWNNGMEVRPFENWAPGEFRFRISIIPFLEPSGLNQASF